MGFSRISHMAVACAAILLESRLPGLGFGAKVDEVMIEDRNELRRELRRRFPRERGQLLPALHFLQHEFGYLPDWAMETAGWHLGVPSSEVYGAATSYTELRIEKPGETIVRVCSALSCEAAGARGILDAISQELGIAPGDTSDDGRFTLEEARCGFLCAMAPAAEIDGRWHGRLNVDSAVRIAREAANDG